MCFLKSDNGFSRIFYNCSNVDEIKIKLRSLKSSEHIIEKGDGPYHGFDFGSG